mmetsp:Transcript_22614/g.34165  ORF Transcript_22614/g.34165 Transcript_22614/m.34165 type:complete len:99 (+) Transcript_22614:353-649(+)
MFSEKQEFASKSNSHIVQACIAALLSNSFGDRFVCLLSLKANDRRESSRGISLEGVLFLESDNPSALVSINRQSSVSDKCFLDRCLLLVIGIRHSNER